MFFKDSGIKEIELDTQLEDQDKQDLLEVISELQDLHDTAMKECRQKNLCPEKCYLVWWIDF